MSSSADSAAFLEGLNDAQCAAVSSTAQQLLVLAGAGSGKTRVLTHRVAWFTEQFHCAATQVLAVTFTNKAAAEVRDRLAQLMRRPVKGLWVGTFHGLGHRMLRMHYQEAGLPQNFQIIDADDQKRLIRRLAKDMLLNEETWPLRQLQYWINRGKEIGVRDYLPEHLSASQLDIVQQLQARYAQYCQRTGSVDFAEILLRSVEVLQQNPMLREHYQQRFRHVLVDEFQDTNEVQYAWLRLLTGSTAFFTVVGDDDQSIYGWRGACVGHIKNFKQDYPAAQVIKLEQNYRSTATILACANAVIACNTDRLGKNLWTEHPQGRAIQLYNAVNDLDEARFVAQEVGRKREQGTLLNEIAVLYRSNVQSRVIEEALVAKGIPYRVYGGLRFFDRAEIKTAIAYLRLTANGHDDSAFERVVNFPARSIGEKSVEMLRQQARNLGVSLWSAAKSALTSTLLPPRATASLAEFMELIYRLRKNQSLSLYEQLDELLKQTGLLAHYAQEAEKDSKAQNCVENLQELLNASKEFDDFASSWEEDAASTDEVSAFLDHVSLGSSEEAEENVEAVVQLMTLHAAKGLEFPVVFMTGMEEGLFPHSKAVEENQLEEERRLCYVGMTRARNELYLAYADSRRLYGQDKPTRPSQFLREIPANVVQLLRGQMSLRQGAGFSAKTSAINPATAPDPGALQNRLTLGMRVRHPRWGEGVVVDMEGQAADARIKITFRSEGSKWLMAQYARLEAV